MHFIAAAAAAANFIALLLLLMSLLLLPPHSLSRVSAAAAALSPLLLVMWLTALLLLVLLPSVAHCSCCFSQGWNHRQDQERMPWCRPKGGGVRFNCLVEDLKGVGLRFRFLG